MEFHLRIFLLVGMFSYKMDDKGDTNHTGQNIRTGLGDLDTGQTDQRNCDQQNGNGNGACPDKGKHGGNGRFLDALVQHIHRYRERHKHHAQGCPAKGHSANFSYIRAFLEDGDDAICSKHTQKGDHTDEANAKDHGENQTLLNTLVFTGLVVEGGHRLEALTHTKTHTQQEHGIAVDHAHRGNGGIAIRLYLNIEERCGNTAKSLAEDRGRSRFYYQPIVVRTSTDKFWRYYENALLVEIEGKGNAKAYKLTYRSCNCRADNSHIKCKNKYRVENDIYYSTCKISYH